MPAVPQDILDRIANLETRLRQAEGRAQIRPALTQILAGKVEIGEGGTLDVREPGGNLILRTGVWPNGEYGVDLYRQSGRTALSIYNGGTNPAEPQALRLYDRDGIELWSDDVVSGGLARPYLQVPFAPARFSDWLPSVSAAFEDVHRATFYKLHPYMSVSVGHTSDLSGTTGEVQVTVNGTPVGPPKAVAFLISTATFGPFPVPGAQRAQVEVRVQTRRTAGTGNVRCHVLTASGIQS